MNFPNAWIGFPPVTKRGTQNKKRTVGAWPVRKTVLRCMECNCRIRGENHKDGAHHRKVNLRK